MGFFRVALMKIASWFLSECFEKHPMSLARLLHAILMMPAEIRLTKDARRVVLKRNPKDRPMMKLLESALHRLRSEEHTSELQSLRHLVCRLLLEKKKKKKKKKRKYTKKKQI